MAYSETINVTKVTQPTGVKMRKQKYLKNCLAIVSTAACSVAVAEATVDYQISDGGLGTFSGSIDGQAINNALAGGIKLTEVGTTVSGTPASYVTICTDVEGTLYLGQTYTYNTPTTFSSSQSTGIDPTWGADNGPGASHIDTATAASALQNAAYLFNHYGTSGGALTGSSGVSGSTDQLEALQLAVWVALYDTTASGAISLAGGRFSIVQTSVDSTVWNDVTAWLNNLDGNYGYAGDLFVPTTGAPDNQNADGQLPQELLYGATPVPEASTFLAGAALVLPLAVGIFRGVRRKQTV
ncbi:MAG: hypothetical protein P4M10_04765 [Verrucomicrobiae bacterium]|nr:hypothetical protein [Verrucomicrobiae bacterium]